jgi:hypothetical protein
VCSVVTRRSLLTFCPLRTLAPSSSLPRWLSMALSLSLSLSSSLFSCMSLSILSSDLGNGNSANQRLIACRRNPHKSPHSLREECGPHTAAQRGPGCLVGGGVWPL